MEGVTVDGHHPECRATEVCLLTYRDHFRPRPCAIRNYVWRTLDPAGGHIGALLLEMALKSVHRGP